jgi:hypothetical protein
VALQLPDGTSMPLPRALVELLRASADEIAEGHSVTVLPSEVSLTSAEVAEPLGFSRPDPSWCGWWTKVRSPLNDCRAAVTGVCGCLTC